MQRREAGIIGERAAAEHLRTSGYEILDTNYRCRYGELDIIARKDGTLVFVEVRARSGTRFGTAEESITPTKVEHLLATAEDYIAAHPGLPENHRIDVVAVRLGPDGTVAGLKHIENAVEGR